MHLDWPPSLDENVNIDTVAACGLNVDDGPNDVITLEDLYNRACRKMQEAESMSRGPSRQRSYSEAKELFEKALELIETLSLFSENETLDDVATSDMKYLLIHAYIAKVILSSECGKDRLKTFSDAEIHLINFLNIVASYGLSNEITEQSIPNSGLYPVSQPKSLSLESAVASRNEKIERYKRMKLLETQLEELSRRLKSDTNIEGELVREYYSNLIKKWISESIESLENEVRPAIYFEKNRSSAQSAERQIIKPPQSSVASSSNTPPITVVRDALQKKVFGLGYPSRPTVTVDEFISKKIKDGDLTFSAHEEVYSNSLQKYAEQPDLRRVQDELADIEQEVKEERDDDNELRRKRQWDEFKDETPRGSGNRHNMG